MYSSTGTVAAIALLATQVLSDNIGPYKFNPLEHLTGLAPPFRAQYPSLDPSPPQGCKVTKAAYLARHGQIEANERDFDVYVQPFIEKLQKCKVDWTKVPVLSFLATWETPVTASSKALLARVGKASAARFGADVAQRYNTLRTPKTIWASTTNRTIKSAEAFRVGLANEASQVKVVDIWEGKQDGANSLTPYKSCSLFKGSAGSNESSAFRKVYTAPPLARFNAAAPAFNFTEVDIYAMQLLCGYETVVRGVSPFCDLKVFTPNEWLGFEYTNDIRYHYSGGYGSPVSAAIGFPWVNATFNTLRNSCKDTNEDLYISFTHRQVPPAVLVAMGLFDNTAYTNEKDINATMPLDRINHRRAWRSSEILPFLTNVAIEKMECDSFAYPKGKYYRVLNNNSPQTLKDCSNGPGESCPEDSLSKWLDGRAQLAGSFGSTCKVNYPNSTDVLTIYDGY